MVSLFRRDRDGELELLRSAVSQLGETSLDGLAAALAWRRRTTERCLAEELRRPSTPLVYDAARGTVRWGPAVAPEADPSPLPFDGTAFATPAPEPRATTLSPPPPIVAAEPAGPPIRGTCPSCHVPLHPATNGAFAVCPRCGKLRSRRTLEASQGPAAGAAEPAPGETPVPPLGEDRRHQEMLAAYVTSRPILCPRCHAPLKHRSLADYVCPSCGREVRFPANRGAETTATVVATAPRASPEEPPAAPAAASSGTRTGRRGSRAHADDPAPAHLSPSHAARSPACGAAIHRTPRAGRPRKDVVDESRGRVICRY
jgi:uncharacterized Zn finger protein (UPF0148 family)